ncbi:MAG TPA: aa3-type cytochrome c oxidase subunit IV [Xanthobacteraceae bacterium]|nr:aa3-type cytochrome c oxidase subunit IV [Xanthobacteraceae bacterium]
MADHGEVQYATATGNDLPSHETGYDQFVQATFVVTAAVVSILFGLAIGGVLGHWLPAAIILVAAVIAAGISGWTGSRTVSLGMVAISALTLLLNAFS